MTSHNSSYPARHVGPLVVSILALTLAGCGSSDLETLHENELAQARIAADAASTSTPDNGLDTGAGSDTDGGNSGTDSGGDSTDSGSGGDSGTDAGTDSGNSPGTDSGGGQDSGSGGNTPDTGSASPVDQAPVVDGGFDLSNYRLVFNDEFDGSSVDAERWNTALPWGPDLVFFDQQQYYVDVQSNPGSDYNPFRFDNGQLVISANQTPSDQLGNSNNQPYRSGVLTTNGKFDLTYGYIEARAQLAPGAGLWPAFWMLSTDFDGLRPELFVMEYDGGRPDSVFHNYNFYDADGQLRSPGQWEVMQEGIGAGFHTYSVLWRSEELVFFIDGVPRYRVVGSNVSEQAMYLILNLAVGGIWPGSPNDATPFPAEYRIDYVRVYQLPDDGAS